MFTLLKKYFIASISIHVRNKKKMVFKFRNNVFAIAGLYWRLTYFFLETYIARSKW